MAFGIGKKPTTPPATQAAPASTPAAQQTPAATNKQAPAAKEPPKQNIETFEKGLSSIVDILAPSSVEVDFRFIRVGEAYYSTLFMAGYPRYVSPGWLQPIIDYDHTLDLAMFCYPTSSSDVLADLKRKIAEMEATLSSDAEQGKVADPSVQAALEDALGLQEELAKGIERFFQFGFYITLSDPELPKLEEALKSLKTTLASLLLTGKLATLQMEEGFKSTLPMGQDRLFITRNMDTSSLASTFPFTSSVLTQNKGVMYGVNQQNGSLIIFDRFSLENANEVVLGKSGAGKSYTIKLEIMRQFMLGAEVTVIDPEGEYETLTPALGGEVVDFSTGSEVKINPFDLSDVYEEGENQLGLKIMSLHGLLKIITGDLDAEHEAIMDRALIETYRSKGITTDPATQKKEPPLMEDLYKILLGMETTPAKDLAYRLEKFIKGSAFGIFNQQSNFEINNPLTVFNIRNLEENLRPVAMHVILDFIWTKVKKTLKKRILILDEGWYMMKFQDSASFVYSIAKRARKYYLGMTTATQDVEDFLKTDYGKAVLTNSSIQILLKQGTAEVDMISETFYLSEGEKALLLSADVGEGLFFAGQNHVAMKVFAAPFEHELVTSNPLELLKRKQEQEKIIQGEAGTSDATASADTPPGEKPAEPPDPFENPPDIADTTPKEESPAPPATANQGQPTPPSTGAALSTPTQQDPAQATNPTPDTPAVSAVTQNAPAAAPQPVAPTPTTYQLPVQPTQPTQQAMQTAGIPQTTLPTQPAPQPPVQQSQFALPQQPPAAPPTTGQPVMPQGTVLPTN